MSKKVKTTYLKNWQGRKGRRHFSIVCSWKLRTYLLVLNLIHSESRSSAPESALYLLQIHLHTLNNKYSLIKNKLYMLEENDDLHSNIFNTGY